MYRILLFTWAIINSAQLIAQVKKDTINEYIDYSRPHRFSSHNKYRTNRLYSQSFGIQLNQLLKIFPNDDASKAIPKNPFGIFYSINSLRTGFGIGLGLGYAGTQDQFKNSLNNLVETAAGKTTFRIGIDKKKVLARHFIIGYGFDVLRSKNKSLSKTFLNGLIHAADTVTTSVGIGPRLSFQVKISERILVGTETSWYFKKIKTKTSTQFTGLPGEQGPGSKGSSGILIPPLAIFIAVKF